MLKSFLVFFQLRFACDPHSVRNTKREREREIEMQGVFDICIPLKLYLFAI